MKEAAEEIVPNEPVAKAKAEPRIPRDGFVWFVELHRHTGVSGSCRVRPEEVRGVMGFEEDPHNMTRIKTLHNEHVVEGGPEQVLTRLGIKPPEGFEPHV